MPLGVIGFLALVALAQTGPSVSVPVRVEFDAPAGCSDADDFLSGVMTRASHVHRARAGETAVNLAVHVTRAGGRVHGELRVSAAGGESETRRVEGATCAEVVQVLSLTAALAIDPTAGVPAPAAPGKPAPASPTPVRAAPAPPAVPTPAASPPAAPAPPAPPVASPPPAVAPAAPAPPAPSPEASPPAPPPAAGVPSPPAAITVVAPPSQPAITAGPQIGASAVAARVLSSAANLGGSIWGRFAVRTRGGLTPSATLELLYLPASFRQSGDDLGIGWTALALSVCPGWAVGGRVALEPCARVTAGALSATDHSVDMPRSVDRSWGSAGALIHLAAPVGWGLTLDLVVGVDVPFVTRRFITTTTVPDQPVGATPTLSPTLSLGLSHGL